MSTLDDMILYDASCTPAILASKVSRITLCGIPVLPSADAVCHWQIYCVIGKMSSVVLDMSPCGEGNDDPMLGVLRVDWKPSETSKEKVVDFTVETTNEVTVKMIIDMIREYGRHHYKFDEGGSGCRFWCLTVFQHMSMADFVSVTAPGEFQMKIKSLHATNKARYPIPVPMGHFY